MSTKRNWVQKQKKIDFFRIFNNHLSNYVICYYYVICYVTMLFMLFLNGLAIFRAVFRAVALDISKAFYRVWHVGLLQKLKPYGISGQIFDPVSSFSNNERLRVVLDGKSSQGYQIHAGVLQGCTFPTIH